MSKVELLNEDCMTVLPTIADSTVNMILCDLPYGNCVVHKWNKTLPLDLLWQEYERIITDNGIICLFANQPFTSQLITSNIDMYRYSWVWKKESSTGFLNANYKPLKRTEDIVIFSKAKVGSKSKNPIPFHPPTLKAVRITKHNSPKSRYRQMIGYAKTGNVLNSDREYIQKFKGYPNEILCFPRDKDTIHPTQKPVALLEYLINTYTDKEMTVLDNCMGSGSTGVACVRTGRDFIGIEKEKSYFDEACRRIREEYLP